jgi:hypothetical protein
LLSFFNDLLQFGRLDLEPAYQRKAGVWTGDFKRYFIDSILRNYPFPTILLNVRTSEEGATTYEVVDGKQRLSTIFEFVDDLWTTSPEHSDDLGAPQYFSDMTAAAKAAFYNYQVTVETIQNGTLDELRQAFDRLNRNVARLNSQELRHAQFYDSKFLKLIEVLADDAFWSDIGIATSARVRRMLDIQFISEIFILTMHGVQDGDGSIDVYYSEYEEEIPDERQHRRLLNQIKSVIERLQAEDGLIKNTRYGNLADLYSLWAAARDLVLAGQDSLIDYAATAATLRAFADSLAERPAAGDAARYLVAARQGSNKGPNRLLRTELLRERIVLRS